MNLRYRLCLIPGLYLLCGLLVMACSLFSGIPFPPKTAATADIEPTIVPILMERSALSGVWTGTETLTTVGSCMLEQGDSVTNPVKMLWRVSEEGEVIVTLPDWPGVYPYTFKGEILPDLSVSLELSTSAMCSGEESPYSSTFDGVIRAEGEVLALDMEATEVWCPGTCVFLRHYTLQKSNASP